MRMLLHHAARGYVVVLIALQLLLFSASLLLHISVLLGAVEPYASYGLTVFGTAVIVGIPVFAFIKDYWSDQIRNCPGWMWKVALGFGVYSLITMLLLFSGLRYWELPMTLSGVPLGFEAISFCVLYPVIRQRYLSEPEIARRAMCSVGMIVLMAVVELVYRAGYLHQAPM